MALETKTEPMKNLVSKWAILGVATLFIAGCESTPDELVQIELSAEELYTIAYKEATTGEIKLASPLFDEVERQHPYSRWATKAQLMSAWALYESNSYEAAIIALDRFIDLNPAHQDIDYAFYLKAMSYYERIVDVERDAGMTVRAKDAFEALLNRFPDSEYSRDALLKLDLTKSHLAGKEMAVARFYMTQGQYHAALRRYAKVVREYDTSNQTPEALYRMVESYLALGLVNEAERSGAVMNYNYPDSIWTQRMIRLIGDPEVNHDPSLFEKFVDGAVEIF